MRKLLIVGVLAAASLGAEDHPPLTELRRFDWYRASQVAVVAAHGADVHSSLGGRELNPLLRGPDGRFGRRGVAIKAAIVGAWLGVQHVLPRDWRKGFTWGNFVMAGVTGGVAVHNYQVR